MTTPVALTTRGTESASKRRRRRGMPSVGVPRQLPSRPTRPRPLRATAWAVAIALTVGACAGQAGGLTPSPPIRGATEAPAGSTLGNPAAFQHFSSDLDVVTFDFPASWSQRKGSINPGGNIPIVFVGPQDLPSDVQSSNGGGAVSGPWPFMHLDRGGAVIAWRLYGMPGNEPPTGGTPLLVGTRPAWRKVASADSGCASIGGDESIDVAIAATPRQGEWIGVDACLSGPDHQAGEAAFAAILASATIPGPDEIGPSEGPGSSTPPS